MDEVHFIYKGKETFIHCKKEDILIDVCKKYCLKMKLDLKNLIFFYGGDVLNLDFELKTIDEINKEKSKMNILVRDKNDDIENEKERIIKSKDIICPQCGELCLLNFNEYKIELNNCKNKHENIMSINEYDDTQNINENKIICDICKERNKGKIYDNIFYLCGTCNKCICPLCEDVHCKNNIDHILINYEYKNYLCHRHNEPFSAYCDICRENLCTQCDLGHNNTHNITLFRDIKPNIDEIKAKVNNFKMIIDKFNNNIEEMIKFLNLIKSSIQKYYMIIDNLLNNYNIQNRNYQIFSNINNIININNSKIVKDLHNIINESNLTEKFNKIYILSNKITNIEKNKIIKKILPLNKNINQANKKRNINQLNIKNMKNLNSKEINTNRINKLNDKKNNTINEIIENDIKVIMPPKKKLNKIFIDINKVFYFDYQQKFPRFEKIDEMIKDELEKEIIKEQKNNENNFKCYCTNYIEINVLRIFKREDLTEEQREILKYNIETILEICGINKQAYREYYYSGGIIKPYKVDRSKSNEALIKFRKKFLISEEDYNDEGIINRLIENDLDINKTFQKMFGS